MTRPIRWAAVALVAIRLVLPLIAVPLIPFLIRDRITLLVLLRPQKEFLLVAGAQARMSGSPSLGMIVAAYIPFMVVAVWAFFLVGRAYGHLLDDNAPTWLRKAIPPHRLAQAHRVLEAKGPWIAVLGRLAAFPPTFLAAAAGSSGVSARRYLVADAVGATLAFASAFGAGWALGRTYERSGPWLTAAGVGLLIVLVGLLTHWLRQLDAGPSSASARSDHPRE